MNDLAQQYQPEAPRPTIRDSGLAEAVVRAGTRPGGPDAQPAAQRARASLMPSTTSEALERIRDQQDAIKKSLDVLISDLTTLRMQL